ncbi:uncharacterized protein LOC102389615 [Bubalus bubalis]|uniref:uncharacterized protein LOC102389615 n=1 Tax=Bubalus bubalis TaxID=89462 RepID=UPI001D11FBD9|nr:uncharacterized protein LOC102389615 [Bubalus bubalis]
MRLGPCSFTEMRVFRPGATLLVNAFKLLLSARTPLRRGLHTPPSLPRVEQRARGTQGVLSSSQKRSASGKGQSPVVWGWFCAQEGKGDPGARLACPLLFPGWRRVLKQRGGSAEELLTRLPHSRILRRPLRSPRLCSTSVSAAGRWRAGALSGLKRLRLESTLPLPPPRRMSVCGRNDCVCARDSLHFQWPFPARPSGPSPAQRRLTWPSSVQNFDVSPQFALLNFLSLSAPEH